MWHGLNKRRFPRVDYQCLLTLTKRGGERRLLTHTENIGVGGICVVLSEDLGLFNEVDIELTLKDADSPIRCRGNIVWIIKKSEIKNIKPVTRFDTGVEFIGIKEFDRQRIENAVDSIIQNDSGENKGVKK